MTGVLIRRDTDTERISHLRTRSRLEGCGNKPRTPECPAAGRGRKDALLEPVEGAQPCPHLHFGPLASGTGRE